MAAQEIKRRRCSWPVIKNRQTTPDVGHHFCGNTVAREIFVFLAERHGHVKKIGLLHVALNLRFVSERQNTYVLNVFPNMRPNILAAARDGGGDAWIPTLKDSKSFEQGAKVRLIAKMKQSHEIDSQRAGTRILPSGVELVQAISDHLIKTLAIAARIFAAERFRDDKARIGIEPGTAHGRLVHLPGSFMRGRVSKIVMHTNKKRQGEFARDRMGMRKIETRMRHGMNGTRVCSLTKRSQAPPKSSGKDRHRHLREHGEATRFDFSPRWATRKMCFARPRFRTLRRNTDALPQHRGVSK